MTDGVTLTGVVATKPQNLKTSTGLTVTNFRLASGQRRFDRATSSWMDAETNWYTVNAFRYLASNVANSLSVGDHVVVAGRLRVRNWQSGERKGISVEVDADSVGHDLTFGVSHFTRLLPASAIAGASMPVAESASPASSTGSQPGWAAAADSGAEPEERADSHPERFPEIDVDAIAASGGGGPAGSPSEIPVPF